MRAIVGSTPPPTPPLSSPAESEVSTPQKPPNRLQRTLSLTPGDSKPAKLFRRRSERGPTSPEYPPSNEYYPSTTSPTVRASTDGYFPSQPEATIPSIDGATRNMSAPLPTRPINSFHRRPTNLSEKAVAKGGLTVGEINLEHGLDIVINCEVNQRDPAGCTVPYRLLVPALWYSGDVEIQHERSHKESWLRRLGSRKAAKGVAARQGEGNWGNGSDTVSESDSDKEHVTYGAGRLETQSKTSHSNPLIDQSQVSSGGGRLTNGSDPLANGGTVPLNSGRRSISNNGQPISTGRSQMAQDSTLDYDEAHRQSAGGQLPERQQLTSPRSSIDQHERVTPGRKVSGKLFRWGASTSPRSLTHHEVLRKRPGGKLAGKAPGNSNSEFEDRPPSQGSSLSERGAPPSSAKKLSGKFFGWGEPTSSHRPIDQHETLGNRPGELNVHQVPALDNVNEPHSQRSSFSEQEGRRPSTGRKLSGKFFGWGEPLASRNPPDQHEIHSNNVRNPTLPSPRQDSRSESPHSSDFSDDPSSPSVKKPAGRFFGWGEPVSSNYPPDHLEPPSSGKNPLSKFFSGARGTGAARPQNTLDEMSYKEELDESPVRSKMGKFDKDGGSKFFGTQGGSSNSARGYGGIDAYKEKDKGWRKFI